MQPSLPHDNPFAVLTAIVAPAILTNACSVLSLGTGNRLARVVDRTRVIAAEMKSHEPGSAEYLVWLDQLAGVQLRAQLLIGALRAFYAALGAFAATALISVFGGLATYYGRTTLFRWTAIAAIATGTFAIIALVRGTVVVMRETRIAIRNLAEEAKLHSRYQQPARPPVP